MPRVVGGHVALGLELLHPEVELGVRAGRAFALDDGAPPPRPSGDAPASRGFLLLDRGRECADRWPPARLEGGETCAYRLRARPLVEAAA